MERLAGLISANYYMAGFGKLTAHRPIACIPFGSRYRLMDFPMSNMVNSGITSVGLITPHLYRSLLDHLGAGKEFGLARKVGGLYVLPGSTYGYDLGTGRFSMRDIAGNMKFFTRTVFDRVVLATCSKIFNIDYRDVEKVHIEKEANVTLLYKKMPLGEAGDIILEFDAKKHLKGIRRLKQTEKNVCLFLDSLIMDRDVAVKLVNWYKDYSYVDMMHVIQENLGRLSVVPYEFTGYVKSINNTVDYLEASKELLNPKVMNELFTGERMIHTKVHDAAPVKYFSTAKVKNALVGTGSLVKGTVENSIIFRNVVVDEGSKIKDSVIMPKCTIGKKAVLENVICEKGVKIGDGEVHKGTKENPVVLSND